MNGVYDNGFYSGPPRGPEGGGRRSSSRGRALIGVVAVAFAVSLAVVVGQRLSDQAISVLAGAVCGVGASIPTSLLIAWVTQRRREQRQAQPMQGVYPPVVVVQPPQPSGPAPQQPGYLPPYVPPTAREFTVVGGDAEETVYRGYA